MAAADSALFAFGESGTSLEAYAMGEKTVAALTDYEDDGESTSSSRYWYYEGADKTVVLGTITNGAPNATADVPSRPAQFANNPNVQYLDLTNSDIGTNVFYRAINSVNGKSSVADLDGSAIGDGFYLDTLVKFTAADSTNNFELASGDKLAITYVEESEDDDEDGVCLSNIVVRAGYVENDTATEKTYIMELPDELKASFVVTNWHRLTVRAIEVGYAAAPVGFVIYLDGCPAPLTYAVGEAAGDSTYTDALAGNAIVNQFLYNSTTHALLPSAVSSGSAKTTLAAVGFMGSGCVDDISFVSGTPGFVEEGKGVAIEWDSGGATVTVRDGDTYYVGSALGGEDVTALAYSATNFTVESSVSSLTVTATYKQGGDGKYEAGTWVTDPVGKYSAATDTLVLEGDNTTLTINSMLPLFDVGGVHYGSFEDALAAATAGGAYATIKLLADYTGDIAFDTENTASIIIDLAGKTLTGDSDAAIHTGCANIIITNSTVEVGHVVAPEYGVAVVLEADAVLAVYAGIFDGEIADDSGETAALTIYGGSFYDAAYVSDPTNDFYLKSFVAEGLTISEPVSGYFTVSGAEPPAPTPTSVEVPTAETGLVYDGTVKTGVVAGEGYMLSGNTATDAGNYTATATLADGYIWSDETTAPKEINWSIAADISATVDVVLTDYEEEYTAQLAFPTASATIGGDAVVGTAAWSPDTITEPAAGATNTYTATFTVTSGNYAGSTGTATFKVYKAAGGGYPSYIPEDAAVKAKYDTWATTYGADTGSIYEDAFLLNIAPDAADQTLEPASITMEGGKVVISANQTLTAVNGKVYVKVATTLAGLETAEWTEATLDEGKVQVTPGSSDTAGFYKIKVDF